jgi:serine/threonine-protein kinase
MRDETLSSIRKVIQSESEANRSEHDSLSPEKPRILGRYKILDEVGKGATAHVYRAYDPQLDRFIAVKVLKEHLSKNKQYRDSFIREARLAAQLTHPNIVTIFDVESSDSKTFIAMELLEGTTLEEVLKKSPKISVRSTLQITSQLAAALAYSHQNGVVHRDIKPGNILLLKDRKSVKLMDFGIAQIEDKIAEKGFIKDKVLGTPEYMSPEQLLGKTVDGRSDLYAMGVLIYRMLAGLPPFVSDDLGDLFKQIIRSKQPELMIDDELVKDELKDLVRRLLQKRQDKRYQTAFQLQSELRIISNKLFKAKTKKQNFLNSLTTRWTIAMASSVFIAMCIGLLAVNFVQQHALSKVIYDYGNSVGKMIAYQSSEAIVLGDSIGLGALVAENGANPQLARILILDTNEEVLTHYVADSLTSGDYTINEQELLVTVDETQIYSSSKLDDIELFDVKMPINFGDKRVGTLVLSYSAESINKAGKVTLVTMLSVMLVTLLVVSFATLMLARKTSKDYRRITNGLQKLTTGRADSRILSGENNDANGVFVAFNQLASYLESVFDKAPMAERETQNVKIRIKQDPTLENQQDIDTVELSLEDGERNDSDQ